MKDAALLRDLPRSEPDRIVVRKSGNNPPLLFRQRKLVENRTNRSKQYLSHLEKAY